jgi:hypothetical protein
MKKSTAQTNQALVFVDNADGGLFNAVTGMAHKVFSPDSYRGKLCAHAYSNFWMRTSCKPGVQRLCER